MNAFYRFYNIRQLISSANNLNFFFRNRFKPSNFSNIWARAFFWFEPRGPFRRKAGVGIVSDFASAGLTHRPSKYIRVRFWDENKIPRSKLRGIFQEPLGSRRSLHSLLSSTGKLPFPRPPSHLSIRIHPCRKRQGILRMMNNNFYVFG